MKGVWGALGAGALELLFPSRANCMGCGDPLGADEGWLCAACDRQLVPIARMGINRCSRCGHPMGKAKRCKTCRDWPKEGVTLARCAYFYAPPISQMIRRMKYGGVWAMSEWMGTKLSDTMIAEGMEVPDVLVPVPMHKRRVLERGFNHAEKLCAALSCASGIPCATGALLRVRRTRQQARLSGNERRHNLDNAFRATDFVAGKRILLVDDVMTTGETCNQCALALRAAGALSVELIALACAK
ncbi:MAG: ComF family protein [Clostridia bacterium]